MGFDNPPITWSELEGTLSGRRRPGGPPANADGGDSPAWSRKRGPYVTPKDVVRDPDALPYAELHAHSSFSFLDGASSPEELLEEAERLGLYALAVTDHDGFYGIVRFAEAAEKSGVKTVFGAELSLGLAEPQNGEPDPEGTHLLVLARQEEGYHRLAAAITEAQLRGGEKGRPVYDLDELAEHAGGHWVVLTGCRKGAVRQALEPRAAIAGGESSTSLVRLFGRDNVLRRAHRPRQPARLRPQRRPRRARRRARPAGHRDRQRALRHPRAAPPRDRRRRRARPAQPRRARRLAARIRGRPPALGTRDARPLRPVSRVPSSARSSSPTSSPSRCGAPSPPCRSSTCLRGTPRCRTCASWSGMPCRRSTRTSTDDDRQRIEAELAVIEQKDFPGYFLIVHDIVHFAKSQGILCQGRGSAANSAVCYLLGITAVDSIFYKLPFERFLSSLRDEEPDIDVDFDSDRREEVIQWVFEKYGRRNAAQVANVIQYRPKNAVRDMAKALGHSPGQQDAWSKQVEGWGATLSTEADNDIPPAVTELAIELLKAPRHLGIHSGGMVLTDRPVGEVVPIEHARMENRTVIQWDKDDAAWMGLVKFDLLGLGMLAALQYCFDLIRASTGEEWALRRSPRRSRRSTTCCARPTRSGCSRWSRAPRWGCCRACSRAGSTTSSCRSRSCGRGRSRAGPCTRSCAASSARSRSPTCTRSSWRRSSARSASRCSRSSSCRWRWRSAGARERMRICCVARWARSAGSSGSTRCARSSTRGWRRTG